LIRVVPQRLERDDFGAGDHAGDPHADLILANSAVVDQRIAGELHAVKLLGEVTVGIEFCRSRRLQSTLGRIRPGLSSDRSKSDRRDVGETRWCGRVIRIDALDDRGVSITGPMIEPDRTVAGFHLDSERPPRGALRERVHDRHERTPGQPETGSRDGQYWCDTTVHRRSVGP
jgi:hypothetical protein